MNGVQLSVILERSPKAIKKMREKLKLKNKRTPVSSGFKWTKEEDQFLIDNYGKMSYKEMTTTDEKTNLQSIEPQPGTSIMMSVRPNKALIIRLREEEYRELEAQRKK
jgi:hypothetical protein